MNPRVTPLGLEFTVYRETFACFQCSWRIDEGRVSIETLSVSDRAFQNETLIVASLPALKIAVCKARSVYSRSKTSKAR